MSTAFEDHLKDALASMEREGLRKVERPIVSPQGVHIKVATNGAKREVINLCANNYLGLADDRRLIEVAKASLERDGFGMASVRFICGTRATHRALEQALARFLGTDDAILFAACFDANGGLFEPLLGPEDAIISDALNHASIIDGIRLCKAKRYRYANSDMNELETRLGEARADGARFILIATDGVFSMDGHLAKLPEVCQLAEAHD
ncbi:MAG: aminotransferase class I/II-fold pyridoxal phosphate-dependent enzyme, partial [Gammaproteobacteria bacterium]